MTLVNNSLSLSVSLKLLRRAAVWISRKGGGGERSVLFLSTLAERRDKNVLDTFTQVGFLQGVFLKAHR